MWSTCSRHSVSASLQSPAWFGTAQSPGYSSSKKSKRGEGAGDGGKEGRKVYILLYSALSIFEYCAL